MEPADITFQQLQAITAGFSEARKLGEGAYGKVYKGEDKNGNEFAVKLLNFVGLGLDDKQFQNEFDNLRRLNHPNVVKLHSYCYETQHQHMQYNGKTIFVEVISRALCLEYVQCGTLQKHLSDESDGLDWHKRYDIIKGTCEGLKYLHEGFKEPIYHLDLKPDNILLDNKMIPKLADFGLSKVFGETKTLVTQRPVGTPGYLPPEYIDKNIISKMFDIFSLGVVMIKIIAGPSGRMNSDEMPHEDFIDLVLKNWRKRLQGTWSGSALEAYCQQVKRCTEIALNCLEYDRQRRPNIIAITHELSEMESDTKEYIAGQISNGLGTWTGSLTVRPLQLRFPLQTKASEKWFRSEGLAEDLLPYKPRSSCPLHLTNDTNHHVAFRIHTKSPADCFMGPLWGVVPPGSKYTRALTITKPPASMYQYLTLESIAMDGEDLKRLFDRASENYTAGDCGSVFQRAKEKGREVHQVKLLALHEQPGAGEAMRTCSVLEPIMSVRSFDLHPTEPWILATRGKQLSEMFYLWNYEKQGCKGAPIGEPKEITTPGPQYLAKATVAKFVAPKGWFVVGDTLGRIFVYTYDPMKEVRRLHTPETCDITCFAIHATKPYVLAGSSSGRIFLWDYENDLMSLSVYPPYQSGHSKISAMREFLPDDLSKLRELSSTERMFARSAAVLKQEGHSAAVIAASAKRLREQDALYELSQRRPSMDSKDGHVVFHSNDTNTFASVTSEGAVQTWNLHTTECNTKLLGDSKKLTCIDYFTHGDEQYLITCSGRHGGRVAEIWDFRSESFFLTLEGHTSYVDVVSMHPSLPILITGSSDGTVRLWNSTTFRLENTLNFGLGRIHDVACLKGSRRIAIGCDNGIALTEIEEEEPVASMGKQ